MPSCLPKKRRRMPNTGVRAMRCASCCSTSRTWIVCWAKTSAARKRNRSMTAGNGHAPKRFAETRSHTFICVQRVSGALPLTSRGQLSRRRKLPEKQSGYLFALLAAFLPPFVPPYFPLYPYYNPNRAFWPDFRRNACLAAKKSRIFLTRSRKRYRGFTQKP